MANPPPKGNLRKQLVKVLAYYTLMLASIPALFLSDSLIIQTAAIALLWLGTRSTFPLKPELPEQDLNIVESWVWFGGAAVSLLVALGGAYYGFGIHDPLKLFQAIGIGVGAWAYLFLACRDFRRTVHHA